MARRKKKSKKSNKSKKDTKLGQGPEGFGRQALAFTLGAVLAPLLVLAMFGLGGSLPVRLFDMARWLIGFTAYLAPVVLIYAAIKIFKSDTHKLPRSVFWGLLLLLMSVSGLAHLTIAREDSINAADAGRGGGMLGHLTDSALFPVLDIVGTVLVLVSVGLLSLLFILRIPIKSFLSMFFKTFKEKDSGEDEDKKPKEKDKKFQLNEGVPVEKGAVKEPKEDKKAPAPTALTTVNDPEWELPGLELLIDKQDEANPGDVEANAEIIKETLAEFNIPVEMEGANVGPRVTQYTLRPPSGVKLSKITTLDNNLSLNLGAESIRIEAPIPGKKVVGVEVPNQKAASVRLHGILASKEWQNSNSPLSISIGKDIAGTPLVADLDAMPHLLVAGQTGSGKSVMINSLLVSLLYRNSPAELKMILVDPKRVELKPFDEMPHLLTPVITEADKTISALKWAVAEMERRYKSLEEAGRRNIAEYNKLKKEESMPYIVIVVDELADLMLVAARDVESLIVRLAAKARAVGIHLVLATQSPRVDVITGLIKANISAKIAFTTSQGVDSRVILDQVGAEKLLGQGDMLYATAQMPKPKRLQGALIEISEVDKVTDFIRMQRAPEYDDEVVAQPVNLGGGGSSAGSVEDMEDTLYDEAVQLVIETGKASTSFLQRRFSIGYTRAARLVDMMEDQGVVAPAQGNKPREVLVNNTEEVYDQEPGQQDQT